MTNSLILLSGLLDDRDKLPELKKASQLKRKYWAFWIRFNAYLIQNKKMLATSQPSYQNFITTGAGGPTIYLEVSDTKGILRCMMYFERRKIKLYNIMKEEYESKINKDLGEGIGEKIKWELHKGGASFKKRAYIAGKIRRKQI